MVTIAPFRWVLVSLAAVLAGWWFAARADADVYWTTQVNNTTVAIGKANSDGTGVDQSFITATGGPTVRDLDGESIAIGGPYIYWGNGDFNANGSYDGSIGRANIDGSGVDDQFVTSASRVGGVAVSGAYIYWANYDGDSIGRAKLDGSNVNQNFITGADSPFGLVVTARAILWTNIYTGTIGRADLDGTNVNQKFITGIGAAFGLAVEGQRLYWNGIDHIGRANLNGSDVTDRFVTGLKTGRGLAADTQHIYWTDADKGTIGRADLDGGNVDPTFIAGANSPAGLAVDEPVASSALDFGSQTVDTLGPPQSFSVYNSGTAALQVSRARVSSGDVDDFLISDDTCSDSTLPVGGTCLVHIRFGPLASGRRLATLTVASNDPDSPLQVVLTGRGSAQLLGTAPQVVAVLQCRRVTDKVRRMGARLPQLRCMISHPAPHKIRPGREPDVATMSRSGAVYATGKGRLTGDRRLQLQVTELRSITPGSYTVMLRRRSGQRVTVRWVTITIPRMTKRVAQRGEATALSPPPSVSIDAPALGAEHPS